MYVITVIHSFCVNVSISMSSLCIIALYCKVRFVVTVVTYYKNAPLLQDPILYAKDNWSKAPPPHSSLSVRAGPLSSYLKYVATAKDHCSTPSILSNCNR